MPAPDKLLVYTIVIINSFHYPWATQAQQLNTEVTLLGSRTISGAAGNSTYAWTTWGAWSPCSRTCGGGVSVQERQCLPRTSSSNRWRSHRRRRKLPGSLEKRSRREVVQAPTDEQHCPGLSKRYHECNTKACTSSSHRDSREEQCAAYDRRPFRGHFYTWVPYVDAVRRPLLDEGVPTPTPSLPTDLMQFASSNAPCILNCRPRGQQFYASLALVADGTPCTKPGFRSICVQGACKIVGREGVLSSNVDRELQCGRKLITGMFTKPKLPLGYSYVTTVPRGACRLNITEGSSSENYIALKEINGSYIVNGDFAVSAPGSYEAVGARFYYKREAGLDAIFAHGPIQSPVEVMILYTKSNPGIKYEYLTDATQDEASNDIPRFSNALPERHHHHRHRQSESHPRILASARDQRADPRAPSDQPQIETNVIGDRQFTWKILSFTQCSRTCGGGLQVGKFRCMEVISGRKDREVSPAHCAGVPPPARRRRCGGVPCTPRWRATPWGSCPACGPAQRTRIVGCVQDHAKGLIKISDLKCPLPMPPISESCNIPNCDGTATTPVPSQPDARRQIHNRDRIDEFRDGPVVTLQSNATEGKSFEQSAFSYSGAGGWLFTEWSECVGWCIGGGVQSRGVRCADPAGCEPSRAPPPSRACDVSRTCDAHQGYWFTSEWSKCSALCSGRRTRGVLCIGRSGRRLRESACKEPRPDSEESCGGSCAPSWYLSDWGECLGACESGVQTRTVWCARGGAEGAGGAAKDTECAGTRPLAKKNCVPSRCTTRPAALKPVPTVSESQQRVTRHQNRNTDIRERSFTDGSKVCEDKLSNCILAVQARLCRYPYYTDNCCRSCHTQRT